MGFKTPRTNFPGARPTLPADYEPPKPRPEKKKAVSKKKASTKKKASSKKKADSSEKAPPST